MDNNHIKKYYKISEVSKICNIKDSTLRYWEKLFKQLNPKKVNKHRLYEKKDIYLINKIKFLIEEKKYSTKNIQQHLKNEPIKEKKYNIDDKNLLSIISQLKEITNILK